MKKYLSLFLFLFMGISSVLFAQGFNPTPNDTLTPIELRNDNTLMLQIYAPAAKEVVFWGPDIPEHLRKEKCEHIEKGVWRTIVGPFEPGTYRYVFQVDGISMVNPLNNDISESNMNVWSLIHVPGAEWMDTKDVPHGSVSEVTYYSETLGKFRRMHVYLPPGYESNEKEYPVFYLLHGAYDSDDAWTTVGRAGFIFDNLIAEKKALPMVVIMPDGHVNDFRPNDHSKDGREDYIKFVDDFLNEIKPYAESNYRISKKREHTAIAGLSMGGFQTLQIALPKLEEYAYIGVFSSGIFLNRNGDFLAPDALTEWEEENLVMLDNPDLKEGLELIWFGIGKQDFLLKSAQGTVEVLKKHNFDVVFKETEGGHVWKLWREYLYEFAQQLFK